MNFAEVLNNSSKVKDLLLVAEKYLERHGIESASLNAELIYCFCRNISRIEMRFELNNYMYYSTNEAFVSNFFHLIEQRASHKPLQYILGKSLFFGTELAINESALIPRPETEELTAIIANDMLQQHHAENCNVLDICCGSGCIALSLAQFVKLNMPMLKCQFHGIDISLSAITLANQNKHNLNLSNVTFEHVSLENFIAKKLSSLTQLPKYDYIACNPPYISLEDYNNLEQELFFEPKIALTDSSDGLTFYKQISQHLDTLLPSGGKLYLECGNQQAEQVCALFVCKGFVATIIKDFANINRFVKITY